MKIKLCQNKPIGRLIFGSISMFLGLASLLSAAYGKGESNGFMEGEDVGAEEAKRYFHENWIPKETKNV